MWTDNSGINALWPLARDPLPAIRPPRSASLLRHACMRRTTRPASCHNECRKGDAHPRKCDMLGRHNAAASKIPYPCTLMVCNGRSWDEPATQKNGVPDCVCLNWPCCPNTLHICMGYKCLVVYPFYAYTFVYVYMYVTWYPLFTEAGDEP